MSAVRVVNLSTCEERFYTCSPQEAVIAAYAQVEHKDFNTWDYKERYANLVIEGKFTFMLGDWSVLMTDWQARLTDWFDKMKIDEMEVL